MPGFLASIFQWIAGLFFSKQAEIAVVGLQASGKTSFVNVITSGQWSEDVVPTVAFNFRKVRKGNVTMKIWDVAGQPRFRSMWERYCNGVDAIVFVVDSVNADKFNMARFELHQLLSQPTLVGVPLLVLGNKNDLEGHTSVKELIKDLQLDKISDRPVSCYSVRNHGNPLYQPTYELHTYSVFDEKPAQLRHCLAMANWTKSLTPLPASPPFQQRPSSSIHLSPTTISLQYTLCGP
ncbi:ADP-ribosylation factor-like protein 8B [Leucoagaricus sp. SymC.cos]|nr:ADP-ribosylation factor-like protein 8B [Leucoagaricus sp. SymC.cos]